jgi:hypothetical protein
MGIAVVSSAELIGDRPVIGTAATWWAAAYRLLLICTLICLALIQRDHRAVPGRIVWPVLLVGWLGPHGGHAVQAVAAGAGVAGAIPPLPQVADGLVGFASGLLLGLIASPGVGGQRSRGTVLVETWLAVGLVGTFLGGPAAAVITCVAVAARCAVMTTGIQKDLLQLPWSMYLTGSTIIYVFAWDRLVTTWARLDALSRPIAFWLVCLVVAGLSLLTWTVTPRQSMAR